MAAVSQAAISYNRYLNRLHTTYARRAWDAKHVRGPVTGRATPSPGIFQFNIQRLFSSAFIFHHTSMDIEHFVTETINNCVRINPSPEASDMLWCATYRAGWGIIDTMFICLSTSPRLINLIIQTRPAENMRSAKSETSSLELNSIFHAGVSSGGVIVFLKAFASFVSPCDVC